MDHHLKKMYFNEQIAINKIKIFLMKFPFHMPVNKITKMNEIFPNNLKNHFRGVLFIFGVRLVF